MYEFNTSLTGSYDEVLEKVRAVLMEEQLGIVSEVDVQAVFKAKMDKEIPFFNDTATSEIYTLSLHDALPISKPPPISSATPSNPATSSPCQQRSEERFSRNAETGVQSRMPSSA